MHAQAYVLCPQLGLHRDYTSRIQHTDVGYVSWEPTEYKSWYRHSHYSWTRRKGSLCLRLFHSRLRHPNWTYYLVSASLCPNFPRSLTWRGGPGCCFAAVLAFPILTALKTFVDLWACKVRGKVITVTCSLHCVTAKLILETTASDSGESQCRQSCV